MKTIKSHHSVFALASLILTLIFASTFPPSANPARGTPLGTVEDNCNIGAMLNAVWTENENGWSGTWAPKGKLVKTGDHTYSKVYSASWTRSKPKGQENEDIPTSWYAEHFEISITGNQVTIGRKDPPMVGKYPAGAECIYKGTIEGNRVKNGTGGCGNWTATIDCR